ncbi:hypothetical protein ACFFUT_00140 [Pseudohalocynthiibacter aestuariivivens]|uniref:Uncharacterized protein n=1 Tax=Pseudohalocynthiibacter aestuariivivens TaxID=1591409 RepID=A0ABV5J9Q9_9RHOB|nr:hypothetical protein [Pseudohalocynthiibacter aestuariivivens]MBS9718328.1 hypothetical protein [Pseudohalocynthiibacter aestuariivivens]
MESRLEVCTAHEEHAEGIRKVIYGAIRKVNATDYPPTEIGSLTEHSSTSRILETVFAKRWCVETPCPGDCLGEVPKVVRGGT